MSESHIFYTKHQKNIDILIKNSSSSEPYTRINAIMALGSSGSERAIPPLIKSLTDNKAIIRGLAVESLGQIGSKNATVELHKYYQRERDPDVCKRMLRVYQKIKG